MITIHIPNISQKTLAKRGFLAWASRFHYNGKVRIVQGTVIAATPSKKEKVDTTHLIDTIAFYTSTP